MATTNTSSDPGGRLDQGQSDWNIASAAISAQESAFVWQGDWIDGRVYQSNEVVQNLGSAWICIVSHTSDDTLVTGNEPGVDGNLSVQFWELFAQGGEALTWLGDWDPNGIEYGRLDAVAHKGSSYITEVEHTSSAATEPSTPGGDVVWDLLAQGGGVNFISGGWMVGDTYDLNDLLSYLGSTYISLQNSQVGNQPDISPTFWELFAQGGAAGLDGTDGTDGIDGDGFLFRGPWTDATAYDFAPFVTDMVQYLGQSYVAKQAHTSSLGSNDPVTGGPTGSGLFWDLVAAKGADGVGAGNVISPGTAVTSGHLLQWDGINGINVITAGVAATLVGTALQGGSTLFVDDGNGRVGVNQGTPLFSLDVTGTGNFTGLLTADSATVTGNLAVDTDTLFVDAVNDRVGINIGSPLHALQIGGSSGYLGFNSGSVPAVQFKDVANEVQGTVQSDLIGNIFFDAITSFNWRERPGFTSRMMLTAGTGNLAVDTDTLFVDAVNDRVGINTTTPGVALDIMKGNLRVDRNGDAQNTLTSFDGDASTAKAFVARTGGLNRWQMRLVDSSTESGSNVGADFDLIRYNDAGSSLGTPLRIVRSTGNVAFNTDTLFVDAVNDRVGVNQPSPAESLDVVGNIVATGTVTGSNTGGGGTPVFLAIHRGASNTSDGGTATAGSNGIRPINVSLHNPNSYAFGSNLVTLPAGTYYAEWSQVFFNCLDAQSFLRNSAGTILGSGQHVYINTATTALESNGADVFTIASSTQIGMAYRVGANQATNGLGFANVNIGHLPIFATLKIWEA